ncbi:hypothetical protein Tco_0218331 [Tanacetum coccineum]
MYVTSKNVVSNKKIITNVDVQNALIVKDVSCVSCAKNVFIPCHDKCLAKYKLIVHSKVRRALFTTPRKAKSAFKDTTRVVSKTRFLVQTTQSKSLNTTPIVSRTKIAAVTPISVSNKHMTGDRSLLKKFVEKFMGTVRFGNDHFAAITGYGDYVQGNITICHVYYVEGLGHNLFSVGQFCDGDLEVAFCSNTCYVRNLEGDDLLTGARESNLYTISISNMVASSHELTVTGPPSLFSTPLSSSSKLSATQRLLSLFKPKTGCFKRYKCFFDELQGRYGYLFEHLKTRFMPRKKFHVLAQHLQEVMEESLPKMNQADVAKMIADAIRQDHENFWAKITSQINNAITNHIPSQVDSSVRNYIPSAVRPRDQDDPHDDAHPKGENSAKRQKTYEHETYVFGELLSGQDNKSEPVSRELLEEMSQTVDEAKLRKVVNEPTPVVQRCQRDPKAPALSLVNQDLLYLKKGNSGSENIVMSLHKFPAVIFPEDDIEERASRWIVERRANGSIVSITQLDYNNLNKNDIEDLYMLIINGKVDNYAKTGLLWSLSVFIKSTVIWKRVHDFQLGVESYQQKLNLIAPTITFSGIKKYKVLSIVSEPVYGIIYKNNKKEKRVMRHQETHKFCDATLKRVLEGLKSYNNNVKHRYVTPSLSKEDVEYLQLFEEKIEKRLKHCDQMRRLEMYVNEIPPGSRRQRPE